MRRAVLFSFYDDEGIVDDYVVYFLKELRKFSDRTLFYSNGPLATGAEAALQGIVDEIIIRKNEGFDVWAHKEGLENIGFDRLGDYDEMLMVNHTCYGPIFPFSELFAEMEKRDCDFWGVTAHKEMATNPFTGDGILPYHLNANFLAIRRRMLTSRDFRTYWENIAPIKTYEQAILEHESLFTERFSKLGYKPDVYLSADRYGSHYPAILDLDETLIDRNPLFKRRALFSDPRFMEHYAGDIPRALKILRETSDYDENLIWRNVLRSTELRNLNTNAALTSVLPDVRLKQDAAPPKCGRIAVCAHIYYTDMLPEMLALAENIPVPYDFIATTNTEAKRKEIEEAARRAIGVDKVIVRVVEQNRGRDMSSLFITCRDLFLDDTYELVCRIHSKKSPQVASTQGSLFKRHMFENLLNSKGYVSNVIDMFHDNPWIGVALPPLIHISYWTMGHAWYSNRKKTNEIKELLGLKVSFDQYTPVGAIGTNFWFRPRALRKLFEHKWQWTDFNAEPRHIDGGLAHALERIISYVAQDAHYTTQQILSSHQAGQNYAMLEYKLQRLQAALPLADFSYHCRMLDDWKAAGYPSLGGAYPPGSVLWAAGALGMAIKRSIAYRSPTTVKVLKRIRRGLGSRSK
jgi:lipopolysaccharide biosynthesis protein